MASSNISASGHGSFSGEPEAVWLTENGIVDRKMRALKDFSFKDPDGKTWLTPARYVVDGASIPRALWSLVGSPYTGDYRRASVVHDKACDDAGGNSAARRAADRMFYHACRAGGCSVFEATVLYIGVRIGAWAHAVPAWRAAALEVGMERPRLLRMAEDERIEADFRLASEIVLSRGEVDEPFEIERRTDEAFSQITGLDLRGR